MTDYFGTKKDDLIDVSKLATDVVNIYPEEGTILSLMLEHNIQSFLVLAEIIYQVRILVMHFGKLMSV